MFHSKHNNKEYLAIFLTDENHYVNTPSSLEQRNISIFKCQNTVKHKCSHVVVSGRRGVFTGVSGLQIAYVSGQEALQEPAPAHCFTSKDLSALVDQLTSSSKFRGVDILLTSQWPRGVWHYGNNPVTRKSRIYKCYRYWKI